MFMTALQVFGGLAIFIFGMKLMSDGLHQVAGEKMRSILRMFSANPLVAVASGAAVTCVIQSSSASTVMVIGFVNAGLLSLVQAMGLIFGANIGTTITTQLVAFDISWLIMPAIIVGLLMSFLKRQSIADWGETILGFGFLFLGMEYMSSELKALAKLPAFMEAFQTFQCAPVNGYIPIGALLGAILIGLVATMLIQSSSACSGIIIALGASGLLDIYTAVALVMGANIGTTVTAQLAAITANRVAKQAALAHTLFNCIGVIVISCSFLITWSGEPAFFALINKISLNGDLPRKIANAHTVFNMFTTLILIPFIPLLAKICEKVIPVPAGKIRYQYLEPHLLDTPPIALTQTAYALRRMLQKAWKMIDCALNIYNRNDEKNQLMVKQLEKREADIDERQKNITDYLAQLMSRKLNKKEVAQIPLLLHCTNDVERIGDHTEIIQAIIGKLQADDLKFSIQAEKEYDLLHDKLAETTALSTEMLTRCTPQLMTKSLLLEKELQTMLDNFETEHISRINSGACRPQVGILYLELLGEIRKISRHLFNINERSEMFYGDFPTERRNNK
ncbi:MAG: Na/Pi cotransporter family protein [Lentisphaeria bacterium]|nr:Na/Pi cotransporter family protein [Lentisphaeria bacterium]